MPEEATNQINEMDRFTVKKAAEDYCLVEVELLGKFEYSFFALILGSLALSLQFSLNFGNKYVGFIIFSWILYLISGSLAGFRIHLHKKYIENTVEFAKSNVLNLTGDMRYLPHDCIQRNKLITKRMNVLFFKVIFLFIEALFFNFLFISLNLLIKSGYKVHNIFIETILIIIGIASGVIVTFIKKGIK